jgi:TRAP-type mannitol/chloroaromatic compound transport system permease small subunit
MTARSTGSTEEDLQGLLRLARTIDGLSRILGIAATWMVLLAALVCALDALLRYGLSWVLWMAGDGGNAGQGFQWLFELYKSNSNTLRDLQLVLFAGMVMLGSAWTFKVNEHVRVDLLYTAVSDRARVWIDLFGMILFLAPFCLLMIYFSWPWFMESWTGNELSQNAGGLPRWPLKLFVPLGFALLLLQGVSEAIKCIACLTIGYRREHAYEKPVQ